MTLSSELAKLLAGNFIERRDARAVQTSNGAYMPDRDGDGSLQPFDLPSLTDHIECRRTFGHYLVNPATNTCRCFVFDLDFNENSIYFPDGPENPSLAINPREIWAGPDNQAKRDLALQIFALADGLARRTFKLFGIKVIVAYSGNKGFHVIGCLEPGTQAAEARAMAVQVLDSTKVFEPSKGKNFFKHMIGYPSLEIEVFPKQDEVRADGFGNLVRLPLGMNRKSHKQGFFLKLDVPFGKFKKDDPLETLQRGSLR